MNNKNYCISLIRFMALFMVIFCHIFEWVGYNLGYGKTIGVVGNFLAVGVQIFFMISGYLYGEKDLFLNENRVEFVLRNSKKILLDYYVYLMLIIIPVYCFMTSNKIDLFMIFKLFTLSGTVFGVHHLWFLTYIIFCYALTPVFFDIREYINRRISNSFRKIAIAMLLISVEVIFLHLTHFLLVHG